MNLCSMAVPKGKKREESPLEKFDNLETIRVVMVTVVIPVIKLTLNKARRKRGCEDSGIHQRTKRIKIIMQGSKKGKD